MAYGTADEALSLFSWLKIVSGELNQFHSGCILVPSQFTSWDRVKVYMLTCPQCQCQQQQRQCLHQQPHSKE